MAFLPLIDIFVASYILERVIVIYLGARFLSKNSVLSFLFSLKIIKMMMIIVKII